MQYLKIPLKYDLWQKVKISGFLHTLKYNKDIVSKVLQLLFHKDIYFE